MFKFLILAVDDLKSQAKWSHSKKRLVNAFQKRDDEFEKQHRIGWTFLFKAKNIEKNEIKLKQLLR
jgi:hypothetical protein